MGNSTEQFLFGLKAILGRDRAAAAAGFWNRLGMYECITGQELGLGIADMGIPIGNGFGVVGFHDCCCFCLRDHGQKANGILNDRFKDK